MDMLRHADEFDWRLTVTGLAYVSRSLIWLMSRGHRFGSCLTITDLAQTAKIYMYVNVDVHV